MNINRIIKIAEQQMAKHPRPCREVGYLFNHGLRTGKLAVWLDPTVGDLADRIEALYNETLGPRAR